jgi:hypothetical protein
MKKEVELKNTPQKNPAASFPSPETPGPTGGSGSASSWKKRGDDGVHHAPFAIA